MHGVVQYGDVAWPVAAASTVQSKSWTVATQVLMTEHEATMVAAKDLNMFVRVVVLLCVVVRCCVLLRVLPAVSGRGRRGGVATRLPPSVIQHTHLLSWLRRGRDTPQVSAVILSCIAFQSQVSTYCTGTLRVEIFVLV